MITDKMYNDAQEVIRLYELQQKKLAVIKSLPILESDMVLEYRDMMGNWYEYTKILQNNIHFYPEMTRVRKLS